MNHYYVYRKESYMIEHIIHAQDDKDLSKKFHKFEKKHVFNKKTHGVTTTPAFARLGG